MKIEHLEKINASYFKHFKYSIYFGSISLLVGVMSIVHAIIPWWFVETPYKLTKYQIKLAEEAFGLGK